MVIETSKPAAEIAPGPAASMTGPWELVAAWREHPEPGQTPSPVERASVSELEQQNRRGCDRPDISPMIHYAQ
jgi:hypothetical protein